MKLWIARDKNKNLFGFTEKPILSSKFDIFVAENKKTCVLYEFNSDLFPEVTFENSPQQVELKLIMK